jgi:aspartyl-tRNA synthetase
MAESMKGLHRSHRCTEVSSANIGEKVTVMGWVQKRRNLGSLILSTCVTEVVCYRSCLMRRVSEQRDLQRQEL